MKNNLLFIFLLFSFLNVANSQIAEATYTVRFHSITSYEGGVGGDCWESGNEEYTLAYAGVNDNVNSSVAQTGCFTCSNNGNCTYGSLTTITTRSNTSVQLNAHIDAYEDDGGNRCIYENGDDCRWAGNVSNVRYREATYPSNGTYTNWNFSNSNHALTYSYTWKYSGSSNAITPSCTQQSVNHGTGNVFSWSVYLTAGLEYEFTTCGSTSSDDTYLRLFGSDGYTIVSFNDDMGGSCAASGTKSRILYTAASTGWHYIELSRYSRSSLNNAGQLFYRVTNAYPAQPSVITGTTTICNGSATSLSVTNVSGVSYAWSYSGTGTLSGGSGNIQTLTPTSSGTLTVTPSNACGNGTPRTINITVNTPSIAPTALTSGTNVCKGATTTLTATGGTLGTGASYEWFSGSCGGTSLGTTTTNTFNVTPNNFGANNYFVRISGNCNTTSCATLNLNITSPTTLSTNNESATCPVNGNQFIEFTVGNKAIMAINPNGTNLGDVTTTSYIDGSVLNIQDCNATEPWFNTATLQRHFRVNAANNTIGNYTVRLYLDNLELSNLMAASTSNLNPNDDVASLANLTLTKYSGINEDHLFTNNCGNGTFTNWPQINGGNINSFITGFNANGRYVEYNIASFSEFWLHGSIDNTPLPIELEKFEAICENNRVQINWSTSSEQNNAFFTIEKSIDGFIWNEIAKINGQGNSNTLETYNIWDNSPSGIQYYRLIQQDFDGTKTTFDAISTTCFKLKNEENEISIYPNPAKDVINISIFSTEDKIATMSLIDLSGKIVLTKELNLKKGTNTIEQPIQLPTGLYLIRFSNYLRDYKSIKIIIN